MRAFWMNSPWPKADSNGPQDRCGELGVFQFLEDQISEGRQIYLVYPLIEESATLDHKDLMDGL